MKIPWYKLDARFKPGTVADIGYSLRLILRQKSKPNDQWILYLAIRNKKEDGVESRLVREVKVAVFKKCKSLQEAQTKAETWFSNWRDDLF